MIARSLFLIGLLTISACKEEIAQIPDPMPLNEETIAHYCMMNIAEHPGPKAQIFLTGVPDPIFFAQVRDAFTYLASAEQDGYVAVVYVNDMSAVDWASPGENNWIVADSATYVIGSDRTGGMGVPELVPFSDPDAARGFLESHGGTAFVMQDIPQDAYLAPVEYVTSKEDAS